MRRGRGAESIEQRQRPLRPVLRKQYPRQSEVLRLARERYGKRARDASDGTVTVRLEVTPGNYLLGFVLGHGGDATVEAPPEVVAALRARVDELSELYGQSRAPRS